MGSINPPEASLDFVPKSISNFLREVSSIANISEKVSKVDDFARGLEQEMKKIDGFKRELPLTMLLLNDAISSLKAVPIQCLAPKDKPVFEEFMPLKKEHTENMISEPEKDYKEKKNWMSSVQLWNSSDNPIIPAPKCISKTEEKVRNIQGGTDKDVFGKRIGARAFMPFKSYDVFPVIRKEKSEMAAAPRNGPQARKQRRCWSPELHRRFINALHQLGGSQVATPKQIRELMQVDGLTNDEVKSHLQKYRLHTRRNQSVVGLWMNKDDESILKASSGSNSTIDEDENSEAYI